MVYCLNALLDNGTQSFIFRETAIISRAVIHGLHTSNILNLKQVFQCQAPMFKVFSNTCTSGIRIIPILLPSKAKHTVHYLTYFVF